MPKEPRSFPRNLPTDELVCLPFLDTGTDEERTEADRELRDRGYPPWLVRSLRSVARVGLWYQAVAWDWASLGAFDVLFGYGWLLMLASPFFFFLSPALSLGLVGAGVASLAVSWLGMRWHRRHSRAP